jgi:hypothetical protein
MAPIAATCCIHRVTHHVVVIFRVKTGILLSRMSGTLPVNLPAVKIIKAKVTLELAMTAQSGPEL